MPDFEGPLPDAAEAHAALHRLAYETRTIDSPARMYPVIGELLGGIRALRQVFDQLASANVNHRAYALDDDGNYLAGAHHALAVADELAQAVAALDQVHDRLNQASGHSSRIAWQSTPQFHSSEPTPASAEPARRWVNVVFLEGDAADELLDLIERAGPDAAITHLAGYDHGDETTQAALENGYVYDKPPAGMLDQVATADKYMLVYNPLFGHVSLNREHTSAPDPAPSLKQGPIGMAAGQHVQLPIQSKKQDWFAHPSGTSRQAGQGLGL